MTHDHIWRFQTDILQKQRRCHDWQTSSNPLSSAENLPNSCPPTSQNPEKPQSKKM
jgi:hypothetical protein